jgi:hypothetical protein
MKVLVVALIFMLLPAPGLSSDHDVTVRDRYGNIVENKERHGNDTTVRDRYGNITRTERYEGQGRKTIRDRYGNIIGTEDVDR